MKSIIKLIGIIAIAAIIGLSFAACNNGTTDVAEGTFTLTDIPSEYNGKYVIIYIRGPSIKGNGIWGQQGATDEGLTILTQINNGKAVVPLIETDTFTTYTGNDTFTVSSGTDIFVFIYETATIRSLNDPALLSGSFSSITFSNGSATKSCKELATWE